MSIKSEESSNNHILFSSLNKSTFESLRLQQELDSLKGL